MTNIFIANGKLQLVLIPSTEIEKLMLEQLCQGPIEVQIHPTLQVGDKQCVNAAVITPKNKE